MILTEKAKEDFIDYLWQSKFKKDDYKEYENYIENQKESHTYADIIEWLSTKKYSNYNLWNYCFSNAYWNRGMREYMESVKQAIIKANKIYNEKEA